jgi:predicted flavoprotein YhiN
MKTHRERKEPFIAVIGGGPAGLIAAEMLTASKLPVIVYDSMRSVGRKFLLAGKGGLNLTHSEPFADFCRRYGPHEAALRPFLEAFGPTSCGSGRTIWGLRPSSAPQVAFFRRK